MIWNQTEIRSVHNQKEKYQAACPNDGHADPPSLQKGSPQKSGYEWCGVF